MTWYSWLLDPNTIMLIVEAVAIAYLLFKRFYDDYRSNSGLVYHVRIMVQRGEFLRQIDSKLVPVDRLTFNYRKATYTIIPEHIQFYDPAPTLIYTLGSSLPLSQTELKEHQLVPEIDLSAEWVYQYIEEKVVQQVIQAGKKAGIDYMTLALGMAIGAVVMLFLLPYLPIKV